MTPIKMSSLNYHMIKNEDRIHLFSSLTKMHKDFIQNLVCLGVMTEGNENTERVLKFIQENPGCHLRQIKRELDMAMGTIQYHLNALEKTGKIISEKHNLYRYYFSVGSFGDLERKLLKILNQDSEREILLFIIERKDPTQTDIVNAIKISHGTANWHLKRLIDFDIIREEKVGKFKKYHLNGSYKNIVNLLQNYHPSIWDKWSNRLAELFLSVSEEDEK